MKERITKSFLASVVFFEIAVLVLVFALYLLSDPQTLKYVVDRATAKYAISYDSISGNFLKTISVKNLKYKGDILAKEAEIDWNLRALIKGDIEIETLSLKSVNIARIKSLILKAQHTSQSKSKHQNTLHLPQMRIAHLFLSTLPYQSDIIKIDTFSLELYDIATNLRELSIKEFSLQSHNNHSNIKVDGTIKNKILHLRNLQLDQINIAQLKKSFSQLEDNKQSDKPFTMIEEILVDKLQANIKPYHDSNYQLSLATLTANSIRAKLKEPLLWAKTLDLHTKSNIADITLQGSVDQNQFRGKSTLNLSQKYFQTFTKIVDFKSLNPIHLKLLANPKTVDANITLKSKQVFAGRYKHYFSAINALKSQVHFDINSTKLTLLTDANISSKYATSLILKDRLTYDGKLNYSGTIAISKLQHFPKYSLPLFNHAIIHYKADSKNLVAKLQTDKLNLDYKMFDYKRADFTLDSKPLEIAQYFPEIPKALYPLKASLKAKMALDFNKTKTIMIDNNITSNAINITGSTKIEGGEVFTKSVTTLSKNSFLPKIDKNIKFNTLLPANLEISYHDKHLGLHLIDKKSHLENSFSYDLNSSYMEETLQLASDTITLKGPKEHLQLYTHTYSLKTLQESLLPLYDFKKRPYDGEVEVNATIANMKVINAAITSRWLVYEYVPYKFAFAEKVHLNLELTKAYALIKNYTFHTYLDYDRVFYATKPSKISFQGDKIDVLSLWVNDGLNTTGSYNLKDKEGHFQSRTQRYHYKGREGDIYLSSNLTTTLKKDKTHIEGDVNLLKGRISYEHRKTHEISDPDIIIIQEEQAALARAKEQKNNLSLDISIHSKKPLTYKVPQIDVEITPDIKIWKEAQKEMELLGRIVINGGTYIQGEKEFIIQPGEVLFGGELLNPYLNIKAQYTNQPYVIDIFVTGTLDSPIVNFSSSPYLSQSDILSMLLFSTTTDSLFEGSSNSSTQALSMLGNTFAKEIIKNFGLTLDKLVLSTNEQGGLGIEIGKKISKKITVIYTNDIVQSIKVRYQHSNSFETDLMLSPESSGIDFLYKSEH